MMREKHQLSKSTFIRGAQCLKSLYLNKHRPFLRDRMDAAQLNKFDRGHELGRLAWQLFPGGVDCSPGHPSAYARAMQATDDLISAGATVIYEAVFQYDGVLVIPDILVSTGEGYAMYEVKSSRKISDVYLLDAALQTYVLKGAGIRLSDVFIIHVNADYVYPGGEHIPGDFFRIVNVSRAVDVLQAFVHEKIREEKETIAATASPAIPVGPQCDSPYPCDFRGHCWKNMPPDSLAYLSSIPVEDRFRIIRSGKPVVGLLQGDEANSPVFRAEVKCLQSREPFVDPKRLKALLQASRQPVFFKILTVENALPMVAGSRPFESLPLAWMALKTNGFVATGFWQQAGGDDPRTAMFNSLTAFAGQGSLLVFWGENPQRMLTVGNSSGDFMFLNLKDVFQSEVLFLPFQCPDRDVVRLGRLMGLLYPDQLPADDAQVLRHIRKGLPADGYTNPAIEAYLHAGVKLLAEMYRIASSFV
jgi:hypothetical protein